MNSRKKNLLILKGIKLSDLESDYMFESKFIENSEITATIEKTIYQSLPRHFTSLDNWPKKTNLLCWSCSRQFNTIPVFIPEDIYEENAIRIMDVKGCFCSFNCAQSYIDLYYKGVQHDDKTRFLILLYEIFNDKTIKIIIPSLPKHVMEQYCGEIGISSREYGNKIIEINNDKKLKNYSINHINYVNSN